MLRKLGAMMSAVCLVSAGVTAQALACLAVIAAAAIAHICARPFDHWLVDTLESFSLATCFTTLYLGLFVHTAGSSSTFGQLCCLAILLVQIAFLVFFLFALLRSVQAFANTNQHTSFVRKEKMLHCCVFFFHFARFKLLRVDLKEGFDSLGLVTEDDKRANKLTKHIYGWDVDKKREMVALVQNKYAKHWIRFTTKRIKERQLNVLEATGMQRFRIDLNDVSAEDWHKVQVSTEHLTGLEDTDKLKMYLSHLTCAGKWISFHRKKLETRLSMVGGRHSSTYGLMKVDRPASAGKSCESGKVRY